MWNCIGRTNAPQRPVEVGRDFGDGVVACYLVQGGMGIAPDVGDGGVGRGGGERVG